MKRAVKVEVMPLLDDASIGLEGRIDRKSVV